MAIPTLQHTDRKSLVPPPTFKHVCVHENNLALTLHSTVIIPDIVPLVVNFNEDPSAHVGRAKLKVNADEGRVYADIWLDTEVPDLTAPPVFLLGTQGHDLFEFEDVNYAMNGIVTAVNVLTNAAAAELGRRAVAEDEPPPEAAI